jgi:hypothetical protein
MMTNPIPLATRWQRFKRHTVWDPSNTDPLDDYRHGPRFWYPGFDLMVLLLGFTAYAAGSPLLNRLFPLWFIETFGFVLMASGVGALVGVVFPAMYRLELAAKMVIVFSMSYYAGTVAALSQNAGENWFIIVALFMIPVLLGPRVTWLTIRFSKSWRRNKKRVTKG